MAYNAIQNSEIAVGKPSKQGLWQKVKDNLDYLFSRISAGGLVNRSFELDSDANGIPDGWTLHLLPGGSSAFETANPMHGAKSYSFTHPGGAGNGGGYIDSDYLECSPLETYYLKWSMRSSVVGIHNLVEIYYYDKAKLYVATETPHNANSTDTADHYYSYNFTPPANARFFAFRFLGGQVDVNVAGTVHIDNIDYGHVTDGSVTPKKLAPATGEYSSAVFALDTERSYGAGTRGAYFTLKSQRLYTPGLYRVSFDAYKNSDDPCYAMLHLDDVAAGTQQTVPGAVGANSSSYQTFVEDVLIGANQVLQLKVNIASGSAIDRIYVRNFRAYLKFMASTTVTDTTLN